jgi:hypothetical protein
VITLTAAEAEHLHIYMTRNGPPLKRDGCDPEVLEGLFGRLKVALVERPWSLIGIDPAAREPMSPEQLRKLGGAP